MRFDFGEEIHFAILPFNAGLDDDLYVKVIKETDCYPSYEAVVNEGWVIFLRGGDAEEQSGLLATQIRRIFYLELFKQRCLMSRAWTQPPSQLRIFEFSALDIAGFQITKIARHGNTCIMEEETGLTWNIRRCLFTDDYALLLQHQSSKHSFTCISWV